MSELAVGSLAGLAANSYVIDVASGSKLRQPGQIIAVESVLKTDTFSASVAAGGNVAVTDLSITHEVEDASNKLLITAFFGLASSSNARGRLGLAVHDGSALIGVGDSAGSRTPVSAGGQISTSDNSAVAIMPSVTFVHTPGAGSKTYTVRAVCLESTSANTLYVNRTEGDDDSSSRPRAVSGLVIQEVSV